MQLVIGEVVALTPRDGATDRATVLLVWMPAHGAPLQSHWECFGGATAHEMALSCGMGRVIVGDIGDPLLEAGPPGLTPRLSPTAASSTLLSRVSVTQLPRQTDPQRSGRRGYSDPRAVGPIIVQR